MYIFQINQNALRDARAHAAVPTRRCMRGRIVRDRGTRNSARLERCI